MTKDLLFRNTLIEYAERCLALQMDTLYDDCIFTVIDEKLCILNILKVAHQGVLKISHVFDSICSGGDFIKDCLYLDLSDLIEIGDDSLKSNNFMIVNCKNAISIGNGAFYKCVDMINIDCRSALYIKDYAFYKCINLSTIALGNAEYIDKNAFYGCNIKKVEFNGSKKEWNNLLDRTDCYELQNVKKVIYMKH